MELKTSENHKKIDLRFINKELVKKISVALTTGELVVSLLSGCGIAKREGKSVSDSTQTAIEQVEDSDFRFYDIPEHESDEIISINSVVSLNGVYDNGEPVSPSQVDFTYEELSHITSLNIVVKDVGNYDFLNYMPNLKTLTIFDLSKENLFDNIDGSRLPGGISIEIDIADRDKIFDKDSYYFLKDISSIESLRIGGRKTPVNMDSDYVQSLHNVKKLSLGLDGLSNFRYKDLTYLNALELDAYSYDIALFFSNEDFDSLRNSGVELSGESISEARNINDKISSIIDELGVNSDSSEQEKLNAILLYVLENFDYDKEVSQLLAGGANYEEETEDFYKEGMLTAAMEGDTQICGNYATMTALLCNRLGLDTYVMTSHNHAWDAIKLGDYYYYVDPTWLDGQEIMVSTNEKTDSGISISYHGIAAEEIFKEGNQDKIDEMNWYLEDPTEIVNIDSERESHSLSFTPAGLELKDIPDDVKIDDVKTDDVNPQNSNDSKEEKKVQFNINGKVVTIGLAAGVGILATLGIGHLVNRKKEEQRRREMQIGSSFGRDNSSTYHSGGFRY